MGQVTNDKIRRVLATGDYVEKRNMLSSLADWFEYPDPDIKGFDEIINLLIDFVVESDDDKLKQEAFDAIVMAQFAQNMENIDFSKIEANVENASPNTQSRFIDVLGYTFDRKYLPTILKYKDHENPVVRESVYDVMEEFGLIKPE